jgi:hypothetical protein
MIWALWQGIRHALGLPVAPTLDVSPQAQLRRVATTIDEGGHPSECGRQSMTGP